MNLMYMYMAIQIYGIYEPDVYVLGFTDIRSL